MYEIEKYTKLNLKSVTTPAEPRITLEKNLEQASILDVSSYEKEIGSLLYLSTIIKAY